MVTNPNLEALILAEPENADHYRVYADWLQEQGDPRGELIALQLRAEDELNRSEKQRRTIAEQNVMAANYERFHGPAAHRDDLFYVTWWRGYFKEISNRFVRSTQKAEAIVTLLGELLDHPSSRFVREMRLKPSNVLPLPRLLEVLAARPLPLLQTAGVWTGEFDGPSAQLLYRTVPQIRRFFLKCNHIVSLGQIDLPELRQFFLQDHRSTRQHWHSIRRARWPKLEEFYVAGLGPDVLLEDLTAIFDAKQLPALRLVFIGLAERGEAVLESLANSKLLPQLEELHLGLSAYRDQIERPLIQEFARFKHLKRLRLTSHWYDSETQKRLEGLYGPVVSFDVHGPWSGDED